MPDCRSCWQVRQGGVSKRLTSCPTRGHTHHAAPHPSSAHPPPWHPPPWSPPQAPSPPTYPNRPAAPLPHQQSKALTRLGSTRPDSTRLDPTRPDSTRPDPTQPWLGLTGFGLLCLDLACPPPAERGLADSGLPAVETHETGGARMLMLDELHTPGGGRRRVVDRAMGWGAGLYALALVQLLMLGWIAHHLCSRSTYGRRLLRALSAGLAKRASVGPALGLSLGLKTPSARGAQPRQGRARAAGPRQRTAGAVDSRLLGELPT